MNTIRLNAGRYSSSKYGQGRGKSSLKSMDGLKSRRPWMAESDQSSSPENRKDRGFPGFRCPLYRGSAPVTPPGCLILRIAVADMNRLDRS